MKNVETWVLCGASPSPLQRPSGHDTGDDTDWALELQAIRAESLGWLPLEDGAYLHHGLKTLPGEGSTIEVVGIPDTQMASMNVLLLL
jgi:hypothetical protein